MPKTKYPVYIWKNSKGKFHGFPALPGAGPAFDDPRQWEYEDLCDAGEEIQRSKLTTKGLIKGLLAGRKVLLPAFAVDLGDVTTNIDARIQQRMEALQRSADRWRSLGDVERADAAERERGDWADVLRRRA